MDVKSNSASIADSQKMTKQAKINNNIIYHFAKRVIDIILSVLGLIVCSPILLITAIAIKAEDPKGTVFYKQPRIGLNGAVFMCYKLRSMYSNADEIKASLMEQNEMDGPVFKIRNDPRITKVGHFIRKWSIDELPQFWNVLKGDISLVGPRPLPVEEELACNAYQRQRELVKPGITCYWQISGRNDIPFSEWIELDLKYIHEQSFWTDIKILFKTIGAVVRAGGGILTFCPSHEDKSLLTSSPKYDRYQSDRVIYRIIKRIVDVLTGIAGLIVVSPILLITIAAIIAEDRGSPFFFQARIGRNCKPFKMIKLRSMRIDAEAVLEQLSDKEKEEFTKNFKIKNDPRITKVGHFIRKTSIDELPQLWNVIRGDMSLVGPRPPLLVEEAAYGEHLSKVMSVRPGITGYWQVHGRSDTSFEERIAMNEYYIDHRSIKLDIKILFDTVKVVFTRRGAL